MSSNSIISDGKVVGHLRTAVLKAPDNASLLVRYAEALFEHGPSPEAEIWLRRTRRLAPVARFVLHSSALALRRAEDQVGSARFFRAELTLDPGAAKALSRLADDLEASGRRDEADRVLHWLPCLGTHEPRLEARMLAARLRASTVEGVADRALETASSNSVRDVRTIDALWTLSNRSQEPAGIETAARWRHLADRTGNAPPIAAALRLIEVARMPTGRAIETWAGWPEEMKRYAWITVFKHAPWLRPLAEAVLAASTPFGGGTLLDAFRRSCFVAVDIGARGLPLGDAPLLPGIATVVAVDSDVVVAERLSVAFGSVAGWHDLRPLTMTLGERAEPRRLRLTKQSGLSSLLEPDLEVAKMLGMSESLGVVEERLVEAVTLTTALQTLGVPMPAHLKLDTQGTELEILRGADPEVWKHVLSVQVEVEFRALYRDQPLFGDVDRFLVERGFELVLLRRNRRRMATGYLEVPGRAEIGWAHTFYMRSVSSFADQQPASDAIVRYCAAAMAYRLTDRALQLLTRPDINSLYSGAPSMVEALMALARKWPERLEQLGNRGVQKDRW